MRDDGPAHVFRLRARRRSPRRASAARLWHDDTGGASPTIVLDPSTGRPALDRRRRRRPRSARTAVEAETLAKTALLAGPDWPAGACCAADAAACSILDDGRVDVVPGPLAVVRLPRARRQLRPAPA